MKVILRHAKNGRYHLVSDLTGKLYKTFGSIKEAYDYLADMVGIISQVTHEIQLVD